MRNQAAVALSKLGASKGGRGLCRLTKAFSKKIEMHAPAVALHFMTYNFCRIHQTLRITPAMAAGVSDHAWELPELVALLDGSFASRRASA
jgi:hypothetical protein